MHAKTDSEVTSLAASSPTRYYVHSPSRDSHDGEKTLTTASFHSTPLASPHHSSSAVPHHRKDHHNNKPWKQIDAIEEGILEAEDHRNNTLPRRCYFLAFVLGFLLLFTLFSLILWGASKPMKPKISIKVIWSQVSILVLVLRFLRSNMKCVSVIFCILQILSFDFDHCFEVSMLKYELGWESYNVCLKSWVAVYIAVGQFHSHQLILGRKESNILSES